MEIDNIPSEEDIINKIRCPFCGYTYEISNCLIEEKPLVVCVNCHRKYSELLNISGVYIKGE